MNLVDAISKPNLNNTQTNIAPQKAEPQVNLTQQADVVDLSTKKNSNKTWIIGAVALGAVGILAGAYALIKKGQLPQEIKQMQKGADEMFETYQTVLKNATDLANEAKEKAEKLKAEVMELFTNNGQRNGQQVAEIVDNDGIKVMRELFEDGTLKRKSLFDDGKVFSITEFGKKEDIYKFDENGSLKRFMKGYQKINDNLTRAEKVVQFENGLITRYIENIKKFENGYKVEKELTFRNGVASDYIESAKYLGTSADIKKFLFVKDGKISGYCENLVIDDKNEIWTSEKVLKYSNGQSSEYCRNYKILADGTETAKLHVELKDGKIIKTTKNYVEKPKINKE